MHNIYIFIHYNITYIRRKVIFNAKREITKAMSVVAMHINCSALLIALHCKKKACYEYVMPHSFDDTDAICHRQRDVLKQELVLSAMNIPTEVRIRTHIITKKNASFSPDSNHCSYLGEYGNIALLTI